MIPAICVLGITAMILLWALLRKHRLDSSIPVASPPTDTEQSPFPGHESAACPTHAPWLGDLKIVFPVKYARRDIVVRPQPDLQRASITKLDGPLLPDLEVVDPEGKRDFRLTNCLEPLYLDVPAWPTEYPNASQLLFGISTSLERLEVSIPYYQRWLAFTKARLIAIVTGPDDVTLERKPMKELESRMRNLGIAVTLVKPLRDKDRMEGRYFSLVKVLYAHRDEFTKWTVFMDDDTFFPSMTALMTALGKFDASERFYLGAMSEEWWTVARYSLMGLGGAGLFLSVPLLQVLEAHYQNCLDESLASAGDLRLFECAQGFGDTRLTHISGLHQIDLHGDRSGLFESGRKLLSLHHWKEGWWDEGNLGNDRGTRWTWFPMDAMHLVADICDTCFLQRWQSSDDMVLSNGYSISTYPTGALNRFEKYHGFEKVERTWLVTGHVEGSINPGFDHYIGLVRPPLKLEEEKIQYRFLDAVAANGGVRQYYHHFGLDGDLDTVVELFWIREEDYKQQRVI